MTVKELPSSKDKFFDGKVICSILRDLRIKGARMTLQQLSAKTGIDVEYLFKLEKSNDTEIKISTLLNILDAMGYDLIIAPRSKATRTYKKKVTKK